MRNAQSAARLTLGLALIAGYVDAYGLIALGTYVSFMSGNTTQAGTMIGQGTFGTALPAALAIFFFVTGSFAGTLLIHSRLRRAHQVLFGIIATGLAAVLVGTWLVWLGAQFTIATLSLVMGMMNAALSRVGAEPVSLTFVTGTLNKMARHLALAFQQAPLSGSQGPSDTHLRRAGLMASTWVCFLLGAILSGAVSSYFGVRALLAPFLCLLALALFSSADCIDG